MMDDEELGQQIHEAVARNMTWPMTDNPDDIRRAKVIGQTMWDHMGIMISCKKTEAIARAIRASDEAAGMVLVPRVATENVIHAIACALDYPSVYMGGPSPGRKLQAQRIYDAMIAVQEDRDE